MPANAITDKRPRRADAKRPGRRAIEGLSTPKGIEEHLILLSVCQTCKYSGLDFLRFLRSGETDVGAFGKLDRASNREGGKADREVV
jgi:hypothetical protein